MLIILYGCSSWTLINHIEKNLDRNWTRNLRAILKTSWKQHPTNQQLYDQLSPIYKTIQIRRTRHWGHCWRSKSEVISNVYLWTPSLGRAGVGQLVRTDRQQLCTATRCSLEELPNTMDDRNEWRRRVRVICARGMLMKNFSWSKICLNSFVS